MTAVRPAWFAAINDCKMVETKSANGSRFTIEGSGLEIPAYVAHLAIHYKIAVPVDPGLLPDINQSWLINNCPELDLIRNKWLTISQN